MWTQAILAAVPMIMSFAGQIFTIVISCAAALIPIAVARAKNIPNHIDVLMRVFKDPDVTSHNKKIIALILIMMTGIIPFITFSFIPFTGVPILGLVSAPIAILLSFILICLTFESVIDPILNSGTIKNTILKSDILKMKEDYLAVKNSVGPAWNKLINKFNKFIEANIPLIDDLQTKSKASIIELCEKIESTLFPSINELTIYINKNSTIELVSIHESNSLF